MAQYQLTIRANQHPETLERILRVVRHRGFTVVNLKAENSGDVIHLSLTVISERELSLLTNQLEKLFDVQEIDANAAR